MLKLLLSQEWDHRDTEFITLEEVYPVEGC